MKKKNPSKRKSDLIFWGVALGFIAFLFLTPWGFKFQSYLRSWLLWSPDTKENAITDKNAQVIGYDWMMISDVGESVYISDFDKPIFLNFWATWCSPCRGEMPSIVELMEKYGDKVDFVLVSPSDDLDKVKQAKKDEGWDFKMYVNASSIP
ncbi:MAG: TlpA family protein disulfide reductase, partial [Flavobacteriales bacterium]|nr:TlpA family protein disulfide reductase [Flavobacteriales bacterium]